MDTDRDTSRIVRSWLEEGRTQVPDHILDAVLDQVPATRQRRPVRLARRLPEMRTPIRLAAATAAIVVALVGLRGFTMLGASSGANAGAVVSAAPSAIAPTSSSRPSPTPIDTASWTTYVSTRFGFSIGHPADWSFTPADHNWELAKDAADTSSPASFTAWDHYLAPDGSVGVSAWSVAVSPGTTLNSWLQAYCPLAENDSPCATIQDRAIGVTVDGHPGSLVSFIQDTQAFVLVNNRVYVVASWRPADESNSLRLLQAFLSTMRLLPAGPVASTPTPMPS